MRHGTAVLASLILVLAPAYAFAGGAFTEASDILGISLATPADQVQSVIKQAEPDAEIIEDHAIIGTGQITLDPLIGYVVNATPTGERPAKTEATTATAGAEVAALQKSIGDSTRIGGDHLRIAISPNEKDNQIYGMGRLVNFPSGYRPLVDAVVASLVAKYGPQAFDDTDPADGTRTFTWALDSIIQRHAILQCDGAFLPPLNGTFKVADMSAASGFARMVDDFTRPGIYPVADWPDCGTILTVRITLATDQDGYASSMYERLLDYKRAYQDVKSFSDRFWTEETSALKLSRQDASKNAPPL